MRRVRHRNEFSVEIGLREMSVSISGPMFHLRKWPEFPTDHRQAWNCLLGGSVLRPFSRSLLRDKDPAFSRRSLAAGVFGPRSPLEIGPGWRLSVQLALVDVDPSLNGSAVLDEILQLEVTSIGEVILLETVRHVYDPL